MIITVSGIPWRQDTYIPLYNSSDGYSCRTLGHTLPLGRWLQNERIKLTLTSLLANTLKHHSSPSFQIPFAVFYSNRQLLWSLGGCCMCATGPYWTARPCCVQDVWCAASLRREFGKGEEWTECPLFSIPVGMTWTISHALAICSVQWPHCVVGSTLVQINHLQSIAEPKKSIVSRHLWLNRSVDFSKIVSSIFFSLRIPFPGSLSDNGLLVWC